MTLFRRKHAHAEKMIRFRRLPPVGSAPEEMIPVSELLRRETLFLSHIWADRDLPPLDETNRILLQGLGDDGHFSHMWEPVQLTEEEHKQLSKRIRKEGPERFVHNEKTD